MAIQFALSVAKPGNSLDAVSISSAFGAGTAFALFLGNGPATITWQTVFSSAPDAVTVLLQATLDGSNWFTIDTSTSVSGEVRTITGSYLGVRANNSAVTNGTGKTLTATILYTNQRTITEYFNRFPGCEVVYYGPRRAGFPEPNGSEIVITAADFRALFSVPQTIIPAITNRIIVPIRIHMRKEAGPAFVPGGNTGFKFGLGNATSTVDVHDDRTVAQANFDDALENAIIYFERSTTTGNCYDLLGLPDHTTLTILGLPMKLFGLTADMTSGGAPVHISVMAEQWLVNNSL